MSKVIVERSFAKDTFPVSDAVVAAGWLPGQCFQLNATGTSVEIGVTDNVLFVGIDDDDELASPPTGSLVTGIYGSGTKFFINHSEEVAAGSATRAYNTTLESGALNANLYVDGNGKFTTASTGSVKGKLVQIPDAGNDYTAGIILRF